MVGQTWTVSRFGNKTDKKPLPDQWSWPKLQQIFSRIPERVEKDGPLWSPVKYAVGATRGAAGALEISALVLDFDEGYAWEDFLDFWHDYTYIVHTTHSHMVSVSKPNRETGEIETKIGPRWRAIFPLKKPFSCAEGEQENLWKAFYLVAADILTGSVVDATDKTIDTARMFYMPAATPGIEPFFHANEGELLDWEAFDFSVEMLEPKPVQYGTPTGSGRVGDDYNMRASWEEILLEHGWQPCNRKWGRLDLWCRPGKNPRTDWSARTGEGHIGDRFVHFSETMEGLTGIRVRKAIDKFGLYARLNHKGNFGEATKALAAKGYGQQSKPSSGPVGAPPVAGASSSERSPVMQNIIEQIEEPEPVDRYFDPEKGIYRAYSIGDKGNAERFVSAFGDRLRYIAGEGWVVWQGERWRRGPEGDIAVMRLGMQVVDKLAKQIIGMDPESEEKKKILTLMGKLQNKNTISNMISLAAAHSQVEAKFEDFDKDPMLVGVGNGTLDLRTGEVRKAAAADMITMYTGCPCVPGEAPRFLEFINQALLGREELMRFVMLSLGYTLSGLHDTHAFWFLTGSGRNGKGVLMNLVQNIMGTYGTSLMPESVMVRKQEQIPADLAKLRGKRFASIPEVNDEKRINESLIKALTGGDLVSARFLNQNYFEFRNTAKLWLTGNQRPQVRNFDFAFKRRLKVVPFDLKLDESQVDTALGDKLATEMPQILWLISQSFAEYQRSGLHLPAEVDEAIEEYEKESDHVIAFIEEECEIGDTTAKVKKGEAYKRYTAWCATNKIVRLGKQTFGARLCSKGVEDLGKGTGGDYYFGNIRMRGELPI